MSLRRLIFASAAAAALLATAPAQAGEDVLFGPVPEWVGPLALESAKESESSLPVRILLLDYQQRMENGRTVTFSSTAMKFQTPQGLSAGNLSIPWRADRDELTVHKVLIHRGDEVIDVLASGQTFTVLRREQNLEMAMLDGVLTANMFPEGLQVGDILEVATTLVSNDPVLAGHNTAMFGPLNAPIDKAHIRLQWPVAAQIRLAKSDDLPDWKRDAAGGFETAELTLEDIEPIPLPGDAPARFALVRFVEASDFASWGELAEVFAPLYEAAAKVPAEGPLRAEVERIRNAFSDPVVRAEAALALVQSRIRYVALAMGDGGLVPADAADTWARRYGDCKAKTALLLAILAELGIEAEAVAVSTILGDTISERLPSAAAFNHILVRAHIGERAYWLDGTRTGDTSLARLRVPHFGWGLPILPEAELVRMVPSPLEEPNYDLAIHMDASKGVRAPVPTSIELVMRGDGAIGMNQALANLVGEARDRALREYWRQRYDFIEPEEVGAVFDEDAGELRLTMGGAATLEWDGVWYPTNETGVGYQADFTREPGHASDAPYVVEYPFYNRTRQTIVLPPDFATQIDEDAPVDETLAGIEYKRHATLADDTYFIERTQRSVLPEFAAKDAPAFQKRLRELADKRVYLRMPSGYGLTEADVAGALETMPNDAKALISLGDEMLSGGWFDEAEVHFTRALELEPDNAVALVNRGIARTNQGALEQAEADFDKAAALDPRNAVVYRGRGLLARYRGDYPAAVAAFTTAIEIEPEDTLAWSGRAAAHAGNNKPELALEDASRAIELSAGFGMYLLRTSILADLGKRAEAAAEIEAMLAAWPGKSYVMAAAANSYAMLGMDEKARPLVEQSLEIEPSAMAYYERSRLRDPSDIAGKLADFDEALRLDPTYDQALMARAGLHWSNDSSNLALADVDEVLRLNPKYVEAYLLRANILKGMGRRDEAVAVAEKIVVANPDQTFAFVAAGRIYGSFNMHDEALVAMDRALALEPEAYIYINRSQIRERTDWDGRLADLDAALRVSPGDAAALYLKSQLFTERGDFESAVEAITLAVKADPNDSYALGQRGIALARAGRIDEAERDFAAARALANDAMALNNLCYPKAVAGVALERALAECEESLRLLPDYAPTLDSRGAVLLRLGRYDEAIRDFDRALELNPDLANSRYLRAVARSRKGDLAGAEADLAIVREKAPELIERMEREGFVVSAPGAVAAK